MADFGLIRPFDVDDGQLDHLSPQEIFVLGYELALVDEALKTGDAFHRLIHVENMDRIVAELKRKNRQYKIVWTAEDVSESWAELFVKPEEPEE